MNPERSRSSIEIFNSATELPRAERTAFLDQHCGGDEALRSRVELLLRYHEKSDGFMETPAFEIAPELLLDDADALLGQHLGHYRIESVLGVGGMGVVYLARDERLGRKVGLKLLPQSLVTNAAQLERLKHEARTASALNHPNIVTIHEIGEWEGTHYIATEFIDGITLRERINQGPLPPNEALKIAEQIASALCVAHAAGIVHRDIKPENIMLRPDGYVKVLDFGIAKFTPQHSLGSATVHATTTQPGMILGTTRYMSPEQARGLPVDARSDIWSLGVVLYEMVGGIQPFPGDTPSDCIASILKTEPPPLSGVLPDIPFQLQAIVQKALRKNADERYQRVDEMLGEIRELQGQDFSRRDGAILGKIKQHKRAALLAAAAVIVTAAALAYSFRSGTRPAALPNDKSIAVLPFADLSQARDQEYLCDGIQEEILTRLSQIADLKVISRTSTRRYKSAPKNLLEIAEQLGVAHILEGTVQKEGDQLRVNVQLINARKDAHVWADNYDRKLTDIFAVESEVAKKIAGALQAKLTGAEQRAIAGRPTENSEAHQAYLKGLYYWSKFPAPDFEKSREYFQQAIQLDAAYAVAHAGLASYYARAVANGVMPPDEGWPKCEAEVDRALELDEALPEAYHPRASLRLYYQRDWPAAEREFRRGIGLNPNWAEIRVHYALCLAAFGRKQDALAEIQRAVELEPASTRTNMTRARILFATGQEDAAIAQCRSTIELDPNYARTHEWLGHFYEKKGMQREAIAEWSKAALLRGEAEEASLTERTYAASGFDATVRALAQKRLEELSAKAAQGNYIPAAEYVLAYARAGDKEQAFTWLAKALEERNWFVYELPLDPRFDALRGDARFNELLSKVTPADRPAIKSLAVLPLENLSADPAQEYFADGMTDELIGDVAQLTPLRVISRTSSMHYKGTKKSLPEIAQELKVDAVIEGTVQRADGRVRVRAQLIDARSDHHLWSQTYERDLQDVLRLQSEIAQAIAREVRAKTTPGDLARLASRPPVRPKAFDDYLQGRYLYWNKRTVDNLGKAIEYFESAIREDPTYALPYVGVADCYSAMGSVHIGALPPPDARRRAEEAALKALELDPTLAEAHSALGYVRHLNWDWAAAEEEFKRAIELNPNYANAHNFYASYLMSRGRMDEVFAASNRARELDPLSLSISAQRGFLLFLARRYDESIEELRGIIGTDPNHYQAWWFLAHSYVSSGRLDGAIAAAEKAVALANRSPGALGILGFVYARAGKKSEATQVLNELLELNKRRYVTPGAVTFVYTGLGDTDQAFVWLEKCYEERTNFMVFLKVVPLLDPLRADPRFANLLQRVGLP